MALDFEKIRIEASSIAGTLDCTITLEVDSSEGVGTVAMIDEEGEEIEKVTITDGGVYNNRQLMIVTDSEGEFLLEAFGQILAKIMWC